MIAGFAELRPPLTRDAQKRFAHLLGPENHELVDVIRSQIERDWLALLERCDDEGG